MSSLKPTIVGLGISMPLLALAAVMLRVKARRMKKLDLGADDFTIIAALIFSIALCVAMLADVYCGNLGGHRQNGPGGKPKNKEEYVKFEKIEWVVQVLHVLGFGFAKLSVILLYRRIFVTRSFKIITWIIGALVCVWTVGFFFASLLDCLPISTKWSYHAGQFSHCVNLYGLFVSLGVSDIILDAFILTLPWYPVWKLQMPLGRKLSVCAIFLLGGFVVAAGIVRFLYLLQASKTVASDLDNTYTRSPTIYWTAIEACIGIVSACLPTLRPLVNERTPESLIRSIRNKMSLSTLWKGSQNLSDSHQSRSMDHESDLSLVARPDHQEIRYQAKVEAAPVQDHPQLARYISVHTDLSQREDIV